MKAFWASAVLLSLATLVSGSGRALAAAQAERADSYLSPAALAISPDGGSLYVACATADQVLVFDTASRKVSRKLALPGSPSGLTLSADGKQLVVTCAGAVSRVYVLESGSGKVRQTLAAGHTALSPVLSHNGKLLFVCNRFNDSLTLFDLASGREVGRIPVAREPVCAALTRDGRFLLAANHLPRGRSDVRYVAATVSLIDVALRKVVKEFRLPNGSINLREIQVSRDGKYACVAQTLGRFQVPVTQLARGWVNTSALTLIDLQRMELLNTVLLDDPDLGAANPWGLGWSNDGQKLCVTHAGTHELSIIDFPALLRKLTALPAVAPAGPGGERDRSSVSAADVANDLSFLCGLRCRVKLGGNGPRALAIARDRVYVADYFSDSLELIALGSTPPVSQTIPLGPTREPGALRRGEMYFNDAGLCFQGWQSCSTCHDDDARVDALNWDLLNDGIGNPKDTRSLVWAHRTPPVMSLGVRATASIAVRNGIQNSLGSTVSEETASAIDEWLKSLQPMPSPYLTNGQLSAAAQRGKKLFESPATGCATCHEPGVFTDLRSYRVGTQNEFDRQDSEFDTPALVELWRTAPYLHDGSAATLRDVLTTRNPRNQHGDTRNLLPQQLDDLSAYLLSL